MKLDGIRQKVFLDRYSLKDKQGNPIEKTPDEMWKRVAKGIAGVEKKKDRKKWEKKFYDVMRDFKFLPGGRILAGAGTGFDVTYYNCFVIPNPPDSRGGIMQNLTQMIEIMAHGGGVGLNLSSLRPRGARVKKVNGFSSGPLNWAELYSLATKDIVQQGGSRRGALMLMLWDWHPDIEEFITVKQDLNKINGANLSVCLSDSFMEAVKKGADWDLVYPDLDDPKYDKKWTGDMDEWKKINGKVIVKKTVKAKYLWNLICEAAWRSAEPGLHFLDRSNKRSNTWYFEKLLSTNPCVTGETLVATPKGWTRVDQIKEGDAIKTVLGSGTVEKLEVYHDKPVFKVKFSDGAELRVTAAHQFHAIKAKGRKKQSANKRFSPLSLAELESGDVVRIAPSSMPENTVSDLPLGWSDKEYGFFMGVLLGDGCITKKTLSRNVVKIAVNTNETEWTSIIRNVLQKTGTKTVTLDQGVGFSANLTSQSIGGAALMVRQSQLTPSYSFQKHIPLNYQNSNKEFLSGLLDGVFSTDGNVNLSSNHPSLRLKTTSKQLAQDVRRVLLCFGIHGRIATIKKVADGNINGRAIVSRRQQYEVIISGAGMKTFAEQIGLSHSDKQKRLNTAQQEFALTGNTWLAHIISIKPDGIETVYDLYESKSDTWITEGMVSRGCGEQPLSAWAVCNLGAMNLAAYVKNSQFDFETFGKDVKVAMRFLDNVIDDTYYFYKENEKVAKDIRRTGLGILGLADALIKMKVKYGSEESLKVIDKIFKTLRDNAYIASSDIAAEKGSFPKYNKEKYQKGWHIKKLPEEIKKRIAKQGIRNAVLLTIAPTGTTSLISGVSSGIEPVYEFEFVRHDRLGKHVMYHPLFEEWKKANPGKAKPDYFVSANDLTPEEHVKVQAIAQDYVDSSISKTVNAPKTHTVEDVKNLYMLSYDAGLKGVTYMRDGSRQGVLERIDDKPSFVKVPEGQAVSQAPISLPVIPRPMMVEGVTYQTETPVGKTYITINHDLNKEPFEVFITVGKSGSDVAAMADALGRMISLNLRLSGQLSSRERIRQVVAQLIGIGGARSVGFGENKVRSLPDAIAKVLSKHFEFRINGIVEDKPKNGTNGNGAEHTNSTVNGLPNGVVELTADGVQKKQANEIVKLEQLTLQTQEGPMVTGEGSATGLYDICPECGGASLAYEEGCKKCYACGYSEC